MQRAAESGADDGERQHNSPTKRIGSSNVSFFSILQKVVCSRIQLTMKLRLFIFFSSFSHFHRSVRLESSAWRKTARLNFQLIFFFSRRREVFCCATTTHSIRDRSTRWAETNALWRLCASEREKPRRIEIGKLTTVKWPIEVIWWVESLCKRKLRERFQCGLRTTLVVCAQITRYWRSKKAAKIMTYHFSAPSHQCGAIAAAPSFKKVLKYKKKNIAWLLLDYQ